MEGSAELSDISPSDLAGSHLKTLAGRPHYDPFVNRVLTPLLEAEGEFRWRAMEADWGIVLRLHASGITLDFVFWSDEVRFSFFAGMREEMDEYPATPEEATESALWLRGFLSHPYEAEGAAHPALLEPLST